MRAYNNKPFVGKQHHHGCKHCHRRYVCACLTPERNDICGSCKTGRISEGVIAWQPQPCCTEANTTLCDKDQRTAYKLAGPGPWFKCRTCARTFPCKPEKVVTT